jgi:hypothetical protein
LSEPVGLPAVLQPLARANERIVTDVFGIGVVPRVSERHRKRRAIVSTDERLERRRVAGARPCHQFGVGRFDRARRKDRRSTRAWHAVMRHDL